MHVQNIKVITKKVERNQVIKGLAGEKGIKKFYQTMIGKREEKKIERRGSDSYMDEFYQTFKESIILLYSNYNIARKRRKAAHYISWT